MADHHTHALVEGIASQLRAAAALDHGPEHKAAKDRTVHHLARALEAANQLHGSNGELGACRFPSNGTMQCANLTQAQCAGIGGSSFTPGVLCSTQNSVGANAKPAAAGSPI